MSPTPYLSLSATLGKLLKSLTLLALMSVTSLATTNNASAYGLFLTESGVASGPNARVLISRTTDGVRLMIQGEYTGPSDQPVYWLIPAPHVINLDDDPPRLQSVSSSAFDELSELSAPRFEGACEGEPNGQESGAPLSLSSGEALSRRALAFNAPKLAPPEGSPNSTSELHRYLSAAGLTLTEELDELITWTLDQNLMMVVFEFEPGALSAEGPSPAVSLDLKVDNSSMRVALKPLSLSVMGRATDVVFWVLDQERYRASFPTRELDMSEVSFTSEEGTDYLPRFDLLAQTQQSQIFVTEYVGTINAMSFQDQALATWRNELVATKLTRLRARLIPAALSTNAQVISLRADPGLNYERSHRIQGYACPEPMGGGEAGVEAGAEGAAEAGVEGATEAGTEGATEAGVEAGAEGAVEAGVEGAVEAGVEGAVEAGAEAGAELNVSTSGGDEGCEQRSSEPLSALALLLLALSALRLRQRA